MTSHPLTRVARPHPLRHDRSGSAVARPPVSVDYGGGRTTPSIGASSPAQQHEIDAAAGNGGRSAGTSALLRQELQSPERRQLLSADSPPDAAATIGGGEQGATDLGARRKQEQELRTLRRVNESLQVNHARLRFTYISDARMYTTC